eukprot:16348-Rhodomonas_salina.2
MPFGPSQTACLQVCVCTAQQLGLLCILLNSSCSGEYPSIMHRHSSTIPVRKSFKGCPEDRGTRVSLYRTGVPGHPGNTDSNTNTNSGNAVALACTPKWALPGYPGTRVPGYPGTGQRSEAQWDPNPRLADPFTVYPGSTQVRIHVPGYPGTRGRNSYRIMGDDPQNFGAFHTVGEGARSGRNSHVVQ